MSHFVDTRSGALKSDKSTICTLGILPPTITPNYGRMQNARRERNSILTAESTWRRLRKAHASPLSPHPPQYRFHFKTPLGDQPFLSNSPEDPRSDSTKIRFPTSITTNSIDQMSVKFMVLPKICLGGLSYSPRSIPTSASEPKAP